MGLLVGPCQRGQEWVGKDLGTGGSSPAGSGVFKPHHLPDLQLASEPFFFLIFTVLGLRCGARTFSSCGVCVQQLWPAGLVTLTHVGS